MSCLDVIIINIINNYESVGAYDIISIINKKFDVLISPGIVYPILKSLKQESIIDEKLVFKKKTYSLTKQGDAKLNELSGDFIKLNQTILENIC